MGVISHLFNSLPIKREKIVLYSFTESYADQPKYIAEELQRRNLPLELVWVSEHKPVRTPRGIRSVCGKYLSRFHLATARVIIANNRLNFYWPKGYRKKPGQIYIQTWHGSYGIKKMEGDVHDPCDSYIRQAKLDSRQIDYLVSNCRWLTRAYRSGFFYTGPILESGSPRNDLLFHPGDTAARVRRELGLPADCKLCLFAPTFRDGAENRVPTLPDFPRLRAALHTRFGGDWRILVRLHPGRRKHPEPLVLSDEHASDASAWADTAELLAAADAMVSDYSSCLFDYLLTGRPAFIFAPDAADYTTRRGLYYPLTDTPFPIAENFLELLFNVEKFDSDIFRDKASAFLNHKGTYDKGHSAATIISHLKKITHDFQR